MAETITYRGIRIVTLAKDDRISDCCRANDIAIMQDEAGWWTCFIDEDGSVEKYDTAFETLQKAMQVARAAAEFSAE